MARPALRSRNAAPEDLGEILRVEQSWPEDSRAGADKFLARMQRFPQGFFLGSIEEDGEDRLIGTITSMPLRYAGPESFSDWSTVTNNGYLFERFDLAACNAIYIVS